MFSFLFALAPELEHSRVVLDAGNKDAGDKRNIFFLNQCLEVGEMTLQLRALAAKILVWFLAPMLGSSQLLESPAPGDLMHFPSFHRDPCKHTH